MAERICTNAEYVEWLKSRVGDAYWYGTYYLPCTEQLLKRKRAQYPEHYDADRTEKYRRPLWL